jgi:hypothetical protein
LFDKDFSFGGTVLTGPARVSPWYTPEERFEHGVDTAPWEGIGTGWFYSVLGGGKEFRQPTFVDAYRLILTILMMPGCVGILQFPLYLTAILMLFSIRRD